MNDLDRLAPDQRAVLSLVLDQHRSYEEVAAMLGMSERAVRDRAHMALDALARDVSPAGETAAPRIPSRPASRRAGALLLAAIVVVVALAILISSGGGKGSGQAASHSPAQASKGASTTSATGGATPKIDKSLPLAAVEPSSKAAGLAYVLSQGKRRAFYVRAEGMPPSSGFFYAVWLYDSPSKSAPLGRAPKVSVSGRMEGGGPLPSNASAYHKIVITRETDPHPAQPGEAVLSGAFSLR
jgi:hypothetical protein